MVSHRRKSQSVGFLICYIYKKPIKTISYLFLSMLLLACQEARKPTTKLTDPQLDYQAYKPSGSERILSRSEYREKLEGFWLAQCIGNWTGLVTEMDKIGLADSLQTGRFYTREDWGGKDLPNIWNDQPSPLSPTIDFVFAAADSVWGADDDTDIEYLYQHLLYTLQTSVLTGEAIRKGWLSHIKATEENYLWVSNQKAFDLMQAGMVPPHTGDPLHNPHFEMIDAQLSTEIFGLFAPTRPDFAIKMAQLPIQTTARFNAQWIAEFYVRMHALASMEMPGMNRPQQLFWMAEEARKALPEDSYAAGMYDFVKAQYLLGSPWESIRDQIYQRYQVAQQDGYDLTAQKRYCNGCFAAGINFAASLVSLFCGEGDLKKTIKIGTLAGWDSDNPTATWAGLLGFMMGKKGVEQAFGRTFSSRFNIHRTRQHFPKGIDDFSQMSATGIFVIDRVVQEALGGGIDLDSDRWYIPKKTQPPK